MTSYFISLAPVTILCLKYAIHILDCYILEFYLKDALMDSN
jgi:hypothetical protein